MELKQVASYKCMRSTNTQNECRTLTKSYNCNNDEKGIHTAADTIKELNYENKQPKHNISLDENIVLESSLRIWCRDKSESFVWGIFNRGRIVLWSCSWWISLSTSSVAALTYMASPFLRLYWVSARYCTSSRVPDQSLSWPSSSWIKELSAWCAVDCG